MKVKLQKIAKPIGSHIQLYRCEEGHLYVRSQKECLITHRVSPVYRAIKISEDGDIAFDGPFYWGDMVVLSERIALS